MKADLSVNTEHSDRFIVNTALRFDAANPPAPTRSIALPLAKTLLLSVLALVVGSACAQSFPNKPIRFVVPVVAGGSPDIFARLIGQQLQGSLGQPVVVENRPGAGQMIGAEHVAKSAPDGYTIMVTTGTLTTSVAIRPKLPFDPVNDLTGVAKIGRGPLLLLVHPSLPVKTVKELIAFANARAGQLNYGSAGSGSMVHFAFEVLAANAKMNVLHVPFKSGAPAVTAMVAGEIPMMIMDLPPTWPFIKANRLRALAVTTAKRSAFVPDLPTVAEAGAPGYNTEIWWGALASAKTPAVIVTLLNSEINKILSTDDMKARLADAGGEPVLMSPEAFSAFVKSEIVKWTKVAKDRNIQAD